MSPTPSEIRITDLELEAFEVQALADTEAEAEEMVEADTEKYVVSNPPFAALPSYPSTEETVEEENFLAEKHYYNTPTTPTMINPPSLP